MESSPKFREREGVRGLDIMFVVSVLFPGNPQSLSGNTTQVKMDPERYSGEANPELK